MVMTFTFEFKAEDLSHYYRDSVNTPNRWYGNLVWMAVCIAGVIFLRFRWDELAYVYLAIFVLAPIVQWTQPAYLRKQLLTSPSLTGRRTIEIDEHSIRSKHATFNSELLWTYFTGHKELAEVFLLFPSGLSAYVFPKRAMTEADVLQLRQLLQAKFPNNKQ